MRRTREKAAGAVALVAGIVGNLIVFVSPSIAWGLPIALVVGLGIVLVLYPRAEAYFDGR